MIICPSTKVVGSAEQGSGYFILESEQAGVSRVEYSPDNRSISASPVQPGTTNLVLKVNSVQFFFLTIILMNLKGPIKGSIVKIENENKKQTYFFHAQSLQKELFKTL